MKETLENRLLHIEEKLSHMERLCQQLDLATQNQEMRLEKLQSILNTAHLSNTSEQEQSRS